MLDLSVSFLNIDFTVCAKSRLNIHQGLTRAYPVNAHTHNM